MLNQSWELKKIQNEFKWVTSLGDIPIFHGSYRLWGIGNQWENIPARVEWVQLKVPSSCQEKSNHVWFVTIINNCWLKLTQYILKFFKSFFVKWVSANILKIINRYGGRFLISFKPYWFGCLKMRLKPLNIAHLFYFYILKILFSRAKKKHVSLEDSGKFLLRGP